MLSSACSVGFTASSSSESSETEQRLSSTMNGLLSVDMVLDHLDLGVSNTILSNAAAACQKLVKEYEARHDAPLTFLLGVGPGMGEETRGGVLVPATDIVIIVRGGKVEVIGSRSYARMWWSHVES